MRLGFALIAAVDTGKSGCLKTNEGGAVNFLASGKQTISALQLCYVEMVQTNAPDSVYRSPSTNKTRYVVCLYYFVKLLVIILWRII